MSSRRAEGGPLFGVRASRCRVWVQTRSSGDYRSMSGLPESGHGWAFYEYTPQGIFQLA